MTPREARLLHVLGYLALRFGHGERALVLLREAEARAPGDPGVARTLALALVLTGAGEAAVAAVDRLETDAPPDGGEPDPAMRLLLRSRALMAAGRTDEARDCFLGYLACQGTAGPC